MWEQQPLGADRCRESKGPAFEIRGRGGLSCPSGHRSWATWERRRTGGLGGPGPGSSSRQPLHTNTPPWLLGRGEGTWDPPSTAGWLALPRAVLGSQGGSHLAASPPHFLTHARWTPQTSPRALLHTATAYSAPPRSSESPSVPTAQRRRQANRGQSDHHLALGWGGACRKAL